MSSEIGRHAAALTVRLAQLESDAAWAALRRARQEAPAHPAGEGARLVAEAMERVTEAGRKLRAARRVLQRWERLTGRPTSRRSSGPPDGGTPGR